MPAATCEQAANAVRCLAIDIVNAAKSGHPGTPMGMAPMATVLWKEFLKFNPKCPQWFNRDRFVLSNGHASVLIYSMLHVSGYNLPVEELKQFRQWGSKTPGHPERHVTDGIEVTTGPLGQGIANAVGLAIAEMHLAGTFNRDGFPVVNHKTYVFCGDGCLMEGVALEAISLAGHLKLENLVLVYDDNNITIDGNTAITFTDDTAAKFAACGWNVLRIENGDSDFKAISETMKTACATKGKPTVVIMKTTIGYKAKLQGTSKVHGAPLGPEEAERVKKEFGRPATTFYVEEEVYALFREGAERGQKCQEEWEAMMAKYKTAHPELAAKFDSYMNFKLPEGIAAKLPVNGEAIATRKASENGLAVLLPALPQMVGGSADLTASNLTRPKSAELTDFQPGTPAGRVINFGIREHAMAAICNGMDAHGGLVPYAATFLNFIGYALGAVRLSALSEHGVIYIATHDGIGLGEDGPTHQPVELLQMLRAMPNLLTFRPADQTETSASLLIAVEHRRTPSVLCLSRQAVPPLAGASIEGVRKGAYTVIGCDIASPDLILIGTGTEVSLCVDAANKLKECGVKARVVSMPCQRLFDQQSEEYKRSVLPQGVAVLSVEPYNALGWERYSHYHVGLKAWGGSAPAPRLYKEFGVTTENVVTKSQALLKYFKDNKIVPHLPISQLAE